MALTGRRPARPWRIATLAAAVGLAALAGPAALLHRRGDALWREAALLHADRHLLDLAAYRWILAHAGPADAFVTIHHDLPGGPPEAGGSVFSGPGLGGPEAFTVIAAGRQLVSGPEFFSHPYVPWGPREARRLRYLAVAGGEAPDGFPCEVAERGLWFLLPNTAVVDTGRVEPIFRSASRTLYRAAPAGCAAEAPPPSARPAPGGSGGAEPHG